MSGIKKGLLAAGISVGVLCCIYVGFSIYFMNHFYYDTTINGVDFSWKTEEEASAYFKENVKEYAIKVRPKEGAEEEIKGQDFSIAYKENGELKRALEMQNPFSWPEMLWKPQELEVQPDFEYNKEQLADKIKALQSFQNEGKTDPVSAAPEFDGQSFGVKAETLGTKVDQEQMHNEIELAVMGLQQEIVLAEQNCYQKPKYTENSPEVANACDDLNKYLQASITYDMVPKKEVVDRQLISTWLSWDGNMKVSFHEDKVRAYMNEFAAKYESLYKTRKITTPGGKVAEVSGGTYGWAIDEATEAEALIASIKAGEEVTKEPVYEQRAAVHEEQDWGKTYVEVDLTDQHMWYIADGKVVFETPVVTGRPYTHATPSGVYNILMMLRNTTLVGNIDPDTGEPEYRTPVSYWMQVTWGGVGFHDADWQWSFGGDMYVYNGSHGCINMPVDAAGTFYNMIAVGTPVIMHY